MVTKRSKKSTGSSSLSEMSSVEWMDPDSVSKYLTRRFGVPGGEWQAPEERVQQVATHKGLLVAVCTAVCTKGKHQPQVLVLGTYVRELSPDEFAGTPQDFASHKFGGAKR